MEYWIHQRLLYKKQRWDSAKKKHRVNLHGKLVSFNNNNNNNNNSNNNRSSSSSSSSSSGGSSGSSGSSSNLPQWIKYL